MPNYTTLKDVNGKPVVVKSTTDYTFDTDGRVFEDIIDSITTNLDQTLVKLSELTGVGVDDSGASLSDYIQLVNRMNTNIGNVLTALSIQLDNLSTDDMWNWSEVIDGTKITDVMDTTVRLYNDLVSLCDSVSTAIENAKKSVSMSTSDVSECMSVVVSKSNSLATHYSDQLSAFKTKTNDAIASVSTQVEPCVNDLKAVAADHSTSAMIKYDNCMVSCYDATYVQIRGRDADIDSLISKQKQKISADHDSIIADLKSRTKTALKKYKLTWKNYV